jgi:hypothetical protein
MAAQVAGRLKTTFSVADIWIAMIPGLAGLDPVQGITQRMDQWPIMIRFDTAIRVRPGVSQRSTHTVKFRSAVAM